MSTTSSTPEQLRRRREAADRMEPMTCGHQDPFDCQAEACRETNPAVAEPVDEAPAFDPSDVVQLWAGARSLYLAGEFPKYASPEWIALHPDDPRRLAAALAAAEMWRKYGDEEALIAWFREASRARPSIADRRIRAELDQAATPKPPHQLRATPGWPPIAIPGKPGRYLYARQEKAA
ncbi:hypothetical protein [Streptomyces mirabilis]|uniref:hypothetical protein n=1 Tax=Streptomyces mirabilis TaxID=68239 RepID=UPI0036DA9291